MSAWLSSISVDYFQERRFAKRLKMRNSEHLNLKMPRMHNTEESEHFLLVLDVERNTFPKSQPFLFLDLLIWRVYIYRYT